VEKGKTYYIVVITRGSGSYGWGIAESDRYNRGKAYYSYNGGETWREWLEPHDHAFKTYGQEEPPDKPDLIVTRIWTVPYEFRPGADVIIKAEIKNIGGAKAEMDNPQQWWLTGFFIDGEDVGNEGTYILEPGDTKTVDISYTWKNDRNSHTIKVKVDYGEWIDESDENNNEKTISKDAPRSIGNRGVTLPENKQLVAPWYFNFVERFLLLQRLFL